MRWIFERNADGMPFRAFPLFRLTHADVVMEQFVCALRLVWVAQQRGMGGRRVLYVPSFYDWFDQFQNVSERT